MSVARARSSRRKRVLASLAAVALTAAGAGVAWWSSTNAHAPAPLAPVALSDDGAGALEDERRRRAAAALEEQDELARVEPLETPTWRRPGILPPPPDTLVALRGRVLDATSDEPVQGLKLSFLSRRPKTVTVETDEEGYFATEAELATGIVSALHVPEIAEPRYVARWDLDPAQFVVPPQASGSAVREVTLRAKSPRHVLEFDVRTPEGLAASGATVSLSVGHVDDTGAFVALARDYEAADARGRVRFGLLGDDVLDQSYRVEAQHLGTLATDVLELDPPFSLRTRTLDLAPGGVVHVQLRNDEGRPIAGVSVRVSAHEGGRFSAGRAETSNALGECVFTPLRAACWTIDVVHPLTGRSVQRQVDLPRGGHAQIDVPLSLAGLRLGVSGAVVDEHGYPLEAVQVAVQSPGEEVVTLETGEAGRFEYWARGTGPLALGVGGGFLDDLYEPSVSSVPFGTVGLVVRRVEPLETRTASLIVVDALTREPVRNASVVLFHAHGVASSLSSGLLRASADCGVAQIQYKPREDATLCIDAPGYKRAQSRLVPLVEEAGPLVPLTIELERGFERRVEVRDRITKRLVSGAKITAGESWTVATGSDGSASLASDTWPPPLRVEASGYAPEIWDPATASFPGTVIWLEPLRAAPR